MLDQEGDVIQLPDPSGLAFDLIQRLDGEVQVSALSKNPYFPVLEPILRTRGWLVTLRDALSDLLATRSALSREIAAFAHLYPNDLDWHFKLLSRKRVLVVGVGGIGTNVSFALCANGVGSLTIVDPDIVDATNLNRQFLFSADDIGLKKVDVVARELGRRFPATKVRPIPYTFDDVSLASNLAVDADLIVICGESTVLHDSPHLCDGVAIMLSGYQGAVGVIGPLVQPQRGSACWSCLMDRYKRPAMRHVEKSALTRASSWNPSGFAINSLTGSICSNVCIGYLSEQASYEERIGVQFRVSSASFQVDTVRIEPTSCSHTTVRPYE
ncbi:HesA/MoeB/ThiF family protein [Pandoraea pulmonicola]|uniref:HesA/MoeB/ThiF family protein n=1 Tax=Pandoraea pulmonicola TaxID=93221 RepID=UPI00135ADAB7|nr:ThiF family adenylyltransferase [Pandoraea pulmonicola]